MHGSLFFLLKPLNCTVQGGKDVAVHFRHLATHSYYMVGNSTCFLPSKLGVAIC